MADYRCEGCATEMLPVYTRQHQRVCPEYLVWSKCLPFPCPKCGLGFKSKLSRTGHSRRCTGSVFDGLHLCFCGKRVPSIHDHLPDCTGPVEAVVLPEDAPLPSHTGCICGRTFKSSALASQHRPLCPVWFVYQRRFTFRCEGCDFGFVTMYSKRAHTNSCSKWKAWKDAKDLADKVFPCPSCGELMRGLQTGLHVNSCKGPWTKADWEKHREYNAEKRYRNLQETLQDVTLTAGTDFVECRICGDRFKKLAVHLTDIHGITARKYRAKYGGSTQASVVQDKWRATAQEKYGVDHHLKDPAIMALANAARVATMRERYGADDPFTAGLLTSLKKTAPEEDVDGMTPETVVYTGDHSYWVQCKAPDGTRVNRNPDFVVYDEARLAEVHSGKSVNEVRAGRVIEVLGIFWHGEKAKGVPRVEYEASRIAEYASAGLECLCIWDEDLTKDMEAVRIRLTEFVGRPLRPWVPLTRKAIKPGLTEDLIVEGARRYAAIHGKPPNHSSGDAAAHVGIHGETWRALDAALRHGLRGLAGKSSLSRLLVSRGIRKGLRSYQNVLTG